MWSMWVRVASSTVFLWTSLYVQFSSGYSASRDSLGQPATNQMATLDNKQDQYNQQDGSRVRLVMDSHGTFESMWRYMEILLQIKDEEITSLSQTVEGQRNQILWLRGLVQEKENNESAAASGERGDRSDIMDALRELQDNIEELKAEHSNFRQTTTLLANHTAASGERGDRSDIMDALRELQDNIEELKAEHSNFRQTTTLLANHSTVSDEALQEVQEAVMEMMGNEVEKARMINQTLALFEERMENLTGTHEQTVSEEAFQEVQEAVAEMKANFVGQDRTINQTLISLDEQMEMLIWKHDGAGCEFGGVLYHNGEHLQDQCYSRKCTNGDITVHLNHTTGNPCAPPFEPLFAGCYYFNSTTVSWCEARKQCWRMGGDLAMGPDFSTVQAYVTLRKQSSDVWVGVRDDVWITGQPINGQEWGSRRPKSDKWECSVFSSDKKLYDVDCPGARSFVCQLF